MERFPIKAPFQQPDPPGHDVMEQRRKISFARSYDVAGIDPTVYHILAEERKGTSLARKIGAILHKSHPVDSQKNIHPEVLDIAAGTGIVSGHLQEMGYLVTALDLSQNMLAYLHEHNPAIVVSQGDMNTRLSFDDESFDAATTLWANRFLVGATMPREVYRILRPGGTFVWPIDTLEADVWKQMAGEEQITKPYSLKYMLEQIGFDVEMESIDPREDRQQKFVYPDKYLVARKPNSQIT